MQAFETVNDKLYPDTALCIYKLILERANLKTDSSTCQKLSYKDDLKSEIISHDLIGATATFLLFGDEWVRNQHVEEKIARLNTLLENQHDLKQ